MVAADRKPVATPTDASDDGVLGRLIDMTSDVILEGKV